MRDALTLLSIGAMIAVAFIGPVQAGHSDDHLGVLSARYLAGSAHGHAAGTHQAVGPVDCSGVTGANVGDNAGGACFDLSAFPEGSDLFLRAQDDHSPTEVSLFAGFDLDGDGCVGCQPGHDRAWVGTDSLGARLVDNSTAFTVFVRATSIEDGDLLLATTGDLTLHVLSQGASACHGGANATDECGRPFKSTLPYGYGCVPGCDGSG